MTKPKKLTHGRISWAKKLKSLLFDSKTFARASMGTKVICVVVIVVIAYLLFIGIRIAVDKAHLNWASHRLDTAQSQLSETLGRDVSIQRSNRCYYDDQSTEFDKGNPYCSVILSGNYTAQNGQDLRVTSAKIRDFFAQDKLFGKPDSEDTSSVITYRYEGQAHGMTCYLGFHNSRADLQSTIPVNADFSMSCDGRVSRLYYSR